MSSSNTLPHTAQLLGDIGTPQNHQNLPKSFLDNVEKEKIHHDVAVLLKQLTQSNP